LISAIRIYDGSVPPIRQYMPTPDLPASYLTFS
jgi:hypothetical protein